MVTDCLFCGEEIEVVHPDEIGDLNFFRKMTPICQCIREYWGDFFD